GLEPETLDPQKSRGDAAGNILRDLYEGLVTESPTGKLVPGTADRWTVSDDGRTYTFHIRDNARWSNGDPVTAGDFVAGLRRTVDPATGSYYAQGLSPIVNAVEISAGKLAADKLGVTAETAHTLRIRLVRPTPYFLGLLIHPSAFPVYRPALAKYGRDFTRPGRQVSNGAYKLSEWVVNDHITLVRNSHYWNNAHTRIDKVVYYPIPDESTELGRYRAGGLDLTYTIPVAQRQWIKAHLGDQLRVAPFMSTYFYAFNLTRPPFKGNVKLRRALSMAIDREIIADKITGLGERPAYGWVPRGINNYQTQEADYAKLSRADRHALAKKLYHEAGYSRERPLDVEIRFNTGEIHKRIAQAIAAMWKRVLGVNSHLVNEEWKVFLQDRKEQKVTQVYRSGWVGDYDDAYTFLSVMLTTHGVNDFGYHNPAYDQLLAEANRQKEPAQRRAMLEKAERMMLADQPIMPIYYYVSKHLIKPWVGGWQDNMMDHHYTRDLFIRPH
ncbi:MAG: peptide ABC transporter substrate-binding protein, partial [Gammaproteobacteria bacterium]